MKILLTGANGYIAKRLLPALLNEGHEVLCIVRDKLRFTSACDIYKNLSVFEGDFLDPGTLKNIPKDFTAAYFLIHAMTSSKKDFEILEENIARNFVEFVDSSVCKQIVYLSGITNESKLSKHLASRKNTEDILRTSKIPVTILRAGIIVGSGSASFEIIRDLVEKLPVMITPRWVKTRCQPISVRDVIKYLTGVIADLRCTGRIFDIGGPDILTYKEMMLQFAAVRGLKRVIISVPVMTPKLSSYWLVFVTSVPYSLAVNLVDSMKIEVICKDDSLEKLLSVNPISYIESVKLAFEKTGQNNILSSWKDSLGSGSLNSHISQFSTVPEHGILKDSREIRITNTPGQVLRNIWSIGGERGWYYGNFLWGLRGMADKLIGGVGLRRGRTNHNETTRGDSLDFWRVLEADKAAGRLLLYAEMKLPGEAWLEFKIISRKNVAYVVQTATFRPKGLWGRAYWYLLWPAHYFIFRGMLKNLEKYK